MVTVSIATNDERGNDTGRISAIQIGDAIDLHWGEIGSEPTYRLLDRKFLWLQRRRYDIQGVREWYGNWCWTGVALPVEEAVKLLNNLMKDDRWHCEGGWCDLTDAFTEGKVTSDLLNELELNS